MTSLSDFFAEYDVYVESRKHELSKYTFDQLDHEDPLTQEVY